MRPSRDPRQGSVAASGTLTELLGERELRLQLTDVSNDAEALLGTATNLHRSGDCYTVSLAKGDDDAVPDLVRDLVEAGVRVHAVEPIRVSLEERLLGILRNNAGAQQ